MNEQNKLIEEILKNPKRPGPFLKMGAHLMSRGTFDEALGFLRKALALGGGSFEIHFLLGKTYAFLNCSELSLQHLKSAQKMNPNQIRPIMVTLLC